MSGGSFVAAELYEYDRRKKVYEYGADTMKKHLKYNADGSVLGAEMYAD